MQSRFSAIINASIQVKQQILQNEQLLQQLQNAVEVITDAFKKGDKVLFCGNGGSAADAQHMAA
jgi:D-sedoheptulose 7-phosphate isomerase